MKAEQRCISKWEKRLAKAEKDNVRYGKYFPNSYLLEISLYKEVISDLKRLTNERSISKKIQKSI